MVKKKIEKTKKQSMYEQYISSLSPEKFKEFEQGFQEELLSELLHAIMKEDNITVRELAKAAGVSPTIVQELKTGKKRNITLLTTSKILNSVGYKISFEPIDARRERK